MTPLRAEFLAVRPAGRRETKLTASDHRARHAGRALRLGAIAGASFGVASCSLLLVPDVSGGVVDSGNDGSLPDVVVADQASDVALDARSDGGCPSARGPAMAPVDEGAFCIDTTEVSRAQYSAFLEAMPAIASQSPGCAWNTTFLPSWTLTVDTAELPAQVNWCCAEAYCSWAGKHLCGRRDRSDGGTVDFASRHNAQVSQWYAACSANGTRPYPYGQTLDPEACHTNAPEGGLEPVGTFRRCEGGYPGIFDLIGNLAEWEDNCAPLAADAAPQPRACEVRGGSYYLPSLRCNESQGVGGGESWGFRCCAERE